MTLTIFDQIRATCERVTQQAQFVHLNRNALADYAASLPLELIQHSQPDPAYHFYGPPAETAAYFLCLDAINFGSAYFPYLQKPADFSGYFDGYFAIAAALKGRFETTGPFTAAELATCTPADCATLFGQRLDGSPAETLMRHFAAAWNELGDYLSRHCDGSALALLEACDHSAATLVTRLAEMRHFQDVAPYANFTALFYKRAQITVADVALAFDKQGPGHFNDLDQLTIFADNAVPHVLRTDGILRYTPALAAQIDQGQRIPPGSPAEVEIRAAAIYAVELLLAALRPQHPTLTAMQLDQLLWHGSHAPRYQQKPPHRTRTVFY